MIKTSLGVTLVLALTTSAAAQFVPIATGDATTHDVWLVDESDWTAELVLSGVVFQSLDLPGYAQRDRLSTVMPTLRDDETTASFIRLPGAGSLHLVGLPGQSALLHIPGDGVVRQAIALPGSGALLPEVYVAISGGQALVASSLAAGGDVYLVDLETGAAPVSLTSSIGPLDVSGSSLRLGDGGAWFVTNSGTMYRADLAAGGSAQVVTLSGPGTSFDDEPVLSGDGTRVAVLTLLDEGDSGIAIVPATGPAAVAVSADVDYEKPQYDHPLGPWLALNQDGSLLAYVETVEATVGGDDFETHEMFVVEMPAATSAQHLTAEPDFPAYIDNVGVIGFAGGNMLRFFAGDIQISGTEIGEVLGSADMFQIDLTDPGAPITTNISQSNAQYTPPFDAPGALYVEDVVIDPVGKNVLATGPTIDEECQTLFTFPLYSAGTPETVTLLAGLDDAPGLLGMTSQVLSVSRVDGELLGAGGYPVDWRLHLIDPPGAQPSTATLVAEIPKDVAVERFTASDASPHAAFVAQILPGLELPVIVDGSTGTFSLPIWQPFALSPRMSYSPSGVLYLGVGPSGGGYKFAAFELDGTPHVLPIPVGHGFPLSF